MPRLRIAPGYLKATGALSSKDAARADATLKKFLQNPNRQAST
jgi:hypothetical protein